MALHKEINGRVAYRGIATIQAYPVSKGTWTVQAGFDKKYKRITGLGSHSAVVSAVIEAQDWIDAQAS